MNFVNIIRKRDQKEYAEILEERVLSHFYYYRLEAKDLDRLYPEGWKAYVEKVVEKLSSDREEAMDKIRWESYKIVADIQEKL